MNTFEFDPDKPWSGQMIRFQREMVESIDSERARRLKPGMQAHLDSCEIEDCQECDISRIQIKRIAEAGL